jgi:hypothetical protein
MSIITVLCEAVYSDNKQLSWKLSWGVKYVLKLSKKTDIFNKNRRLHSYNILQIHNPVNVYINISFQNGRNPGAGTKDKCRCAKQCKEVLNIPQMREALGCKQIILET